MDSKVAQETVDRSALAEVLHYGTVINGPHASPALPFSTDTLSEARERKNSFRHDHSRLLEEGSQLWKAVCRRVIDSSEHPLIVSLSAGLDSRAVLAGLRACDAPVRAVTYGIPGAFDYELAVPVASTAGARLDRIDLRSIELSRDSLLSLARRSPRPSMLIDMFYNDHIAQRFGPEYTYVNGFIGDVLAGKNLGKAGGTSWDDARRQLAAWCRISQTLELTATDMNPLLALPTEPLVALELMPANQQLDYAVRQNTLCRPIVSPPGVNVSSPFLDPAWCAFMLGLPDHIRHNRAFFIELFQHAFPKLFALPTTASGGLPLGASDSAMRRHKKRLKRRQRFRAKLNRVFPKVNVPPANRGWQYLDFRELLRQDTAIGALYEQGMARLDASGMLPWLKAQDILATHRARAANHTKALHALYNLDLLLEARPDLFRQRDNSDALATN